MRLRWITGSLALLVVVVALAMGFGGAGLATSLGRATPTPPSTPSPSDGPTASDAPSGTASPTAAAPTPHVVMALGDSVPSGARCNCRPFPQTYGALLSARTGEPVSVDNRAVGGLTTSGLLAQLHTPAFQAAVRRADIFLVTIGANDFSDHHQQVVDGTCEAGDNDCVSDELTTMGEHLATALDIIRSLRGGQPTTLLVTGYWNVFQDGDVARRAYGESGLQASRQLTDRANAVIRSVAGSAGGQYVDIYQPFQRYGRAITSLLAWDGDHPDAAGHRLIAHALLNAGLPRTS